MLVSNISSLANYLGILALICCVLACLPAIAAVFTFFISDRLNIILIARHSLIAAIFLGLVHGLLMTQKLEIDFYDLNTYWVYAAGLFSLNLLILIAFSFTNFKNNLKKLIYFTSAALFLLICHIWQQII